MVEDCEGEVCVCGGGGLFGRRWNNTVVCMHKKYGLFQESDLGLGTGGNLEVMSVVSPESLIRPVPGHQGQV